MTKITSKQEFRKLLSEIGFRPTYLDALKSGFSAKDINYADDPDYDRVLRYAAKFRGKLADLDVQNVRVKVVKYTGRYSFVTYSVRILWNGK